jgi:succinate dehydrogenase/fumarate reductase cytochrome b subunit
MAKSSLHSHDMHSSTCFYVFFVQTEILQFSHKRIYTMFATRFCQRTLWLFLLDSVCCIFSLECWSNLWLFLLHSVLGIYLWVQQFSQLTKDMHNKHVAFRNRCLILLFAQIETLQFCTQIIYVENFGVSCMFLVRFNTNYWSNL